MEEQKRRIGRSHKTRTILSELDEWIIGEVRKSAQINLDELTEVLILSCRNIMCKVIIIKASKVYQGGKSPIEMVKYWYEKSGERARNEEQGKVLFKKDFDLSFYSLSQHNFSFVNHHLLF